MDPETGFMIKETNDLINEEEVESPDQDIFKGILISDQNSEHSDNESVNPLKEFDLDPGRSKQQKLVLASHIEVIEGAKTRYRCRICNSVFSFKYHARYHNYCASGVKPFECNVCNRRFVKKMHLKYHIRAHAGDFPFECLECGKKFQESSKLKRHKNIHEGKSKNSMDKRPQNLIKCDKCSKFYSSKSTLNRHLLVAHDSSRKFICEICGKEFSRKECLVNHQVSHSGLRNFKCDECPKKFKSRKELIRHQEVHSDVAAYECKICELKFKRSSNMNRHIRLIHPDDEAPSEITKSSEKTMASQVNVIIKAPLGKVSERVKDSVPSKSFTYQSVITHTSDVAMEQQADIIRDSVIKLLTPLKRSSNT